MHTVSEIATSLGATADGDVSIPISGANEPGRAGANDIAVALSQGFLAQLKQTKARAALAPEGTDWRALGLEAAIFVTRGRLAMAGLTQILDTPAVTGIGIHPSAIIADGAQFADDVTIGPFTTVAATARIGHGARIGGHVTIGENVEIGAECIIVDGARILERVRLGQRVRVQANAVIGSDGFSFVTATPAHVEIARKTLGEGDPPVLDDAQWHRLHSLGGVNIGDDVEIGAGTTVDAGTLRPTRIGRGTKLDNLVLVAHNVEIGEDCLLCAQSGVAGSATIGDRTVIGGQAGVADNISIGSDVVLGGGSGVLSNVPNGRVMLGYPATKMARSIESYQALRRLPRLLDKLRKQT